MAAGGIRDHLGGGFHRYSVDRTWLVPHFEKMLYDQALLAGLYVEASLFFEDREYAEVAEEILEYVAREMTSADGGFFSAQDADSQGEEGKFFVWTRDEILAVLGGERGSWFCDAYGVTADGNFEGRNILHRAAGKRSASGGESELAAARAVLLERRSARVPPETDRKIVADWNGLMISAMATAAAVLQRDDLMRVAERAAGFVRESMMNGGRLRHVQAGGEARVPAFLDDYAFFGRACLDLFAVSPRKEHFQTAVACADRLLAEFLDPDGGGFFFTGIQSEKLVARTCDLHDGAVPAGNSVAADLLLRLWTLTGDDRYRQAGESVMERFLGEAVARPYSAAWLLCVAARSHRGLRTVVIAGEDHARSGLELAARHVFDRRTTVIAPAVEEAEWFPSVLRAKSAPIGGAVAYLCEGTTCSLPMSSQRELRIALRGDSRAGGER
jgi:uncharacterized protein YyaL (SSP411 family)